jgi:hypothetical protein
MSIVLLTKDALLAEYLPDYGNEYWTTPNISELAKKGTVFRRHYTAAPSTAMSFLAMTTGKYPYEFDRKEYKHEEPYTGRTIFDEAKERGLEPHIVWSDNYMKMALPFANCFTGATIHTLDMNQPVGPHLKKVAALVRDDAKSQRTLDKLYDTLDTIDSNNVFLWIHLPHVLLGRTCYGGDMDLFDDIVGYLRRKYGDESIFISADHGNMNGEKSVYAYGFHVYEPAVHIPLIAPYMGNQHEVHDLTSNTQLASIMFEKNYENPRKYILSETTYYLQANRKTAVISGRYKLIRNKYDRTEELYDILYDKTEERNLLNKLVRDVERNRYNEQREMYFYPYYEEAEKAYGELNAYMNEIWRTGTPKEEKKARRNFIILQKMRPFITKRKLKKKKVRKD